jgi:hypothetical protein
VNKYCDWWALYKLAWLWTALHFCSCSLPLEVFGGHSLPKVILEGPFEKCSSKPLSFHPIERIILASFLVIFLFF